MRAQLQAQRNRNSSATDAPDGADELRAGKARRWRISFPKLAPIEVLFTPEATRVEALAACDGAVEATPIHEGARRTATAAEADELRALVATILAGASDYERSEALATAVADPTAALACFRVLAGSNR